MMRKSEPSRAKQWTKRIARAGAGAVVIGGAGTGAGACLSRPVEPVEPRTTSTVVERLAQSAVDKIDILLTIDNSRSMADKQAILALAVPDLVERLVNPPCVASSEGTGPTKTPDGKRECEPGLRLEFDPIVDIHIGIISSSLGGHGSDSCPDHATCTGGGDNTTGNDRGHLLARKDPCAPAEVATYEGKRFLFWDPEKKGDPPGATDQGELIGSLRDMVIGVDQVGCGFEAPLEAIYRFLADPTPYESISVVEGYATPDGRDDVLLQQRADFMRPSSLLAVIMLTDENDCSVRDGGQYFYATQQKQPNGKAYHLPKARSECAENPADPCCASCNEKVADSCGADANCPGALSDLDDNINLRCFDQKRRFGIDFLYPVERYVNMFQQVSIAPASATLLPEKDGQSTVPNPIYTDLDPKDSDSTVRDTGLVFFAGIVGVPWELIARDAGDLTQGFKNSEELAADGVWDKILGDPTKYVRPADWRMVESVEPRAGATAGSEYTIADRNDLQYACTFPLPEPRNCADDAEVARNCDCADPTNDNPLCEPNPDDEGQRTLQTRAKGYPGLRQLAVLKGIGSQGITASVCPKQLEDAAAADYGYRPAVDAIVDRLKTALGGQCLPRSLTPDANGRVSCIILEARKSEAGCGSSLTSEQGCATGGHSIVASEHLTAIQAALADPVADGKGWNCFCEIDQLVGEAGDACRDEVEDELSTDGWCYIDATTSPPTGNVELVKSCAETERRKIRFVGEAEQSGTTLFITCTGE